MRKKIILAVIGVIILIIGGFVTYVSTLDWNEHKTKLADNISELIGERVEFSGNLNVSLFPVPHLYAEDVKIINPATSEKLATIENMSTSVSLVSLLKKTPDIKTLEINGMEIWLKVQKDGKTNWSQNAQPSFLNSESDSSGNPQNFNLRDTTVHLDDELHQMQFKLENLTADIEAYGLQGPYHFDGNFTMDGEAFAMSIGLGDISSTSDISLAFNITHAQSKSFLRYDGTWQMKGNLLKGVISGSSDKTASFMNLLAHKKVLDEQYDVPLKFSGNIDRSQKALSLDTLVIKFENLLNGSGNIYIPFVADEEGQKPKATVKYQMIDLDIRPIANMLKNQFQRYQSGSEEYTPNTQINVEFDLSAAHLVVSDETGGYFETTSTKGSWIDNALNVDEFFAACPGNITFQLNGSLVEENKKPRYFAKVSLDGQNLLSWLNAVGIKLTAPVQSSYRNPKLTFSAYGDTQSIKLENLSLEMDKMKLKSEINVLFADNLYQIDITADKINFDNYITTVDDTNNDGWKQRIGTQLQNLGDHTLQVNLHTEGFVFGGIEADSLTAVMTANKNLLNIQEFQTKNFLESDIKLSGNFSNFTAEDIIFTNVETEVISKDFAALLNRLKITSPDYEIYKQKKINFAGFFDGQANDFTTRLMYTAAENSVDYDGKILNYANDEEVKLDGKLSAKTMNFANFLQSVGFKSDQVSSLSGVFNGNLQLKGTFNEMHFNDMTAILGKSKYTGNGTFAKKQNQYVLNGDIIVNELNIENWMDKESVGATSLGRKENDAEFLEKPLFDQDVINYDIYKNLLLDLTLTADKAYYKDNVFEKLQLHILNNENLLQFENVIFVYDGAIVKGDMQIHYQNEPTVNGTLDFDNIMLTALGGRTYGISADKIHAIITFDAPADSFAQIIYGMDGKIVLDGNNLQVRGIDLNVIANDLKTREYSKGVFQAIRDNLQRGETLFDTFGGNIVVKKGVYNFVDVKLENTAETVILSGNVVPEEWKTKTDFSVTYKNLSDIPPYYFSFSGPINKPILDVNIGNVAKKYDEHWETLEKEERDRKLAEQESLAKRMSRVQEKLIDLDAGMNNLRTTIEKYKEKSDINANLNQYSNKLTQLDVISADTDKMRSLGRQSQFSEDEVAQLEKQYPEYYKQVEVMKDDIERIYDMDVKQRRDNTWNEARKISADARELFEDYQKMLQDDFNVLLKIEASQYMINNAELKGYQAKMLNLSDKILDAKSAFYERFEAVSSLTALNDIEMATFDLKQELEDMYQILHNMESIQKKSADMLLEIINERRKVYQRELERREAKKAALLKEQSNTEEISSPEGENVENIQEVREQEKSESVKTEDIQSVNAEQKNDQVGRIIKQGEKQAAKAQTTNTSAVRPILVEIKDDTINGSQVSGSITKSYDDRIPSSQEKVSSGLLKAVDGVAQKATGTINVK